MYRLSIIMLISIIFLTGCGSRDSNTLTFKGESNHWRAEYVQKSTEVWFKDLAGKQHYKNSATFNLTLKYKGTDLSNIGLIKYSYEAGTSSGYGENTSLDKNGVLHTGNSRGRNVALVKSDDVVLVNVEWNGMKENIELTTK